MMKDKKTLAIIPARGGSKGLRDKNIFPLAGKPLIAWTIEAAQQCSIIDRVFVSTDDQKIAETAEKYGVDVPFLRPPELAGDATPMIDVLNYCIGWFENQNAKYDFMLLLQPTSPLRSAEDIKRAIKQLSDLQAGAIVSVCEVDHHPFWMNTLPEDLSMKEFLKPEANVNRQNLPQYYRLTGAIFLARMDYYIKNNGFYGNQTYALIMSKEHSVDIDSIIDLKLAEVLLKERLIA